VRGEVTVLDLSEPADLPGPLVEYRKTATMRAVRVDEPFQVATLEGTMTGQAGDYLVVGVKGERYPCAADVLAASYEPVETEQPGA
jgi:hypothetical protein